MSKNNPMTMRTLRVPPVRKRPKFAPEVPAQIRSIVWMDWLKQELTAKRGFYPLSDVGCADLLKLLEELNAMIPNA